MQSHVDVNINEVKNLYEKMLLIRYFEKEVEYHMKHRRFHGTTHLCIGQEATAVGVCSTLKKGDKITSTHRGHGHSIAMGADVNKMMAEIFGKVTGYCKGKGGSMHIADVAGGNLGSNGIVGGSIPIAVGSALTAQLKASDHVTVCFFGDGATNEGSFHEALNLAAIWNLPVVFVCENNEYGMSSSIKQMTNIEKLSERAHSYGFPGVTIDGNDVFTVIREANKAIHRARSGAGPTLIEAKTYRFRGHSRSDKERYRSIEEVEARRKNDPVLRVERMLKQQFLMTEQAINNIKKIVNKKVEAATTFALMSDEPKEKELFTDVYA